MSCKELRKKRKIQQVATTLSCSDPLFNKTESQSKSLKKFKKNSKIEFKELFGQNVKNIDCSSSSKIRQISASKQKDLPKTSKCSTIKQIRNKYEKKRINYESSELIKVKQIRQFSKDVLKKTQNGKKYNLKLVSWNVNGLREWTEQDDGLNYLKAEDPDIFCCCQEIKCDKSKLSKPMSLDNYHTYWLTDDDKQGYFGVGLMTKMKPLNVTYGLDNDKHDKEERVIIAEYEKFFLVTSYSSNSNGGVSGIDVGGGGGGGLVTRLDYKIEWNKEFRQKLKELDSIKPIIWCGDFNVASAYHKEIDLLDSNKRHKLQSAHVDFGMVDNQRECFNRLLTQEFFDSFKFLYPAITGIYSFYNTRQHHCVDMNDDNNNKQKNLGWRFDYIVLSERLKQNLVDTSIRSDVIGSDHCPVVLFLNF